MRQARKRTASAALALLLVAVLAGCDVSVDLNGGGDKGTPVAAPEGSGQGSQREATKRLGFPEFATKNTTRVGGADPAADAAGVALATFPSLGGTEGPAAVSLVASSDWAGGIAASVLVAAPVRAPVLVGESGGVPEATSQALTALAPQGNSKTDDAQVFRIGAVEVPAGLRHTDVTAAGPAEIAAGIAKLRDRLFGGPPDHVVVASQDLPEFAMPAAAWAARSGDPVLFAGRDGVPKATLAALRGYRKLPVYLLGPQTALPKKVLEQVRKVTRDVKRVGGPDPAENAVAFARYSDRDFGWNLNDPGHGFVLANATRPLDAGASAALSASGTWGALLLTDSPDALPPPLRGYLLDLKPGYQDDPTRAVYNRVWVIGDETAVSAATQAQVDELAELAKVGLDRGGRSAEHEKRGGKATGKAKGKAPPNKDGKQGKGGAAGATGSTGPTGN